jgi:hypothetical protein
MCPYALYEFIIHLSVAMDEIISVEKDAQRTRIATTVIEILNG